MSTSSLSRYLIPFASFTTGAICATLISHYIHTQQHTQLTLQHQQILHQLKQEEEKKMNEMKIKWEQQQKQEEQDDDEEEESEEESGDETRITNWHKIEVPNVRHKMVLVVRKDLKMGTGKMCAQCSHAATGIVRELLESNPKVIHTWERWGQAKIAVQVQSEAEMMAISAAADAAGLPNYIVHDAGHTQVAPNTRTVLAVGPAPVAEVDKICGGLKLL